ncbi:MAG: cupredoxin family copper-binding protein [bacterium]|nr:cupredoxin family copper-binding protein [bacterium]
MAYSSNQSSGYGKRPMWQWILIYVVVGGLIYWAIAYFGAAKKGGSLYGGSSAKPSASQTSTVPAASNTVTIADSNYSPATLTVKVGDTVTWVNQDSVSHTATASDNSFGTGMLSPGQSGTVTFSKAGTFVYHCQIHPSMTGTIIVQ